MLRRAGLAVIATIFFTGLHLLQVWLDEQRATTPKSQEFMYLPSGEHLKLVSLGYDDVVADLLWLEAIQAMGERKFSEAAGHWVGHVLDVVTTLDPQFVRVYEAGGV